mmetsp:Transcript_18763/g.24168  ORF Transcript_18763/g.24168 Transcript_18763/m.24168 type:complete len:89 (+) Transcript_18763:132-398(+)
MVEETGIDLQEVVGADNLCAGLKAGIEGGVHSMRDMWEDENVEGELLLDAGNAFNTMYREAALWNARVLWPRCSRFLLIHTKGFLKSF